MSLVHAKKYPWEPLDIEHVPLSDIPAVLRALAGNTRHPLKQQMMPNGEMSYAFDEQ